MDAVRRASEEDLSTWDARTVDVEHGHVFQSLAWGRHRARFGWLPEHIVLADGSRVLALRRSWPIVGGSSAYVTRGPIPVLDPVADVGHLDAVADWLGRTGTDVIAADPEIPATPGLEDRLRGAGFARIEELQPSRHRMDVALPADRDADALFRSFDTTTRQRIRQASRQGLVVRGFEASPRPMASGAEGPGIDPASGDRRHRLEELYAILHETATRRRFAITSLEVFLSGAEELIDAGHAYCLLAEREPGDTVAGALFYRHGTRHTFALSGEVASARASYPGAMRLLVWHAAQLAVSEGRTILDLGGVDVPGARRRPIEGEPEFGMLTFKESFGATWVELAGAHERVVRPARYALGRLAARLARGR